MAGYIGNRAVGLNVTTGDILGDVGVGGDVSVGDDLAVTGNVGIGTSTPGQLLEIDAGSGNNAGITIRMGTGSSGANDSFIGFENSAGTEIFRTRYDNPTTSYVVESDLADPILTLTRAGLATLKNGLTLTDGNLTVAAGHGINFAAQTSANSVTGVTTADELLDHYEEGTWTPLLPSGGTVGTIIKCIYTRIGNLVNVYGNVFLNPTNNNTIFYIAGLPYASTGNNSHGMGTIGYSGGADVSFFGSSLVDGSSRIYYHRNNASTDTAKNSFAGGANRQMVFQAAYLI